MATRCRLRSAQPTRRGPGSRHARGYGNDWGRAAHAAVAAWVQMHGWVCPGWGRPAHDVGPGELTGDHRLPRAFGGTERDGIDVLCQSCNSARGQQTRAELAALRADGLAGVASKISRAGDPPPELRPGRFLSVRVPAARFREKRGPG